MNNKVRAGILMLTLIGLTVFGYGVVDFVNTLRFLHRAQRANGVIIENVERHQTSTDSDGKQHDETYFYPRVRFKTAAGRSVVVLLNTGSNPPSYNPGDTAEIFYDPADPAGASLKDWSLWFLSGMSMGLGGLAAAVGFAFLIAQILKKKKETWLHGHGRVILAEFTSVERGAAIVQDSPRPYYIACQWLDPQTNQVHVFKSDSLSFDPTSFITTHQIQVSLDPQNFKRYCVDLSFLPQLAVEKQPWWRSLASWPRRQFESYRARWRTITGSSLDMFLMGFYHLCMVGLLYLGGALSEKAQLSLTVILVAGIVQVSMWQRRALGWRRQAPADDFVKSLLIICGIGVIFFIAFAFLLPIKEPAFLPWYLVVAGLLAFNILRIAGIVTLTREDFRKSCRVPSASLSVASPSPSGEPAWKRHARTAYEIVFVAVWLAAVSYFFLVGFAIRAVSGLPDLLAALSAHQQALLLTPTQQPFLDALRTALYIAIPCVILATILLQFALNVPIFPKQGATSSSATSAPPDAAARQQPRSDSASHTSQQTT